MYIGVDIVDINRVKLAIERTPRFLERIFTPGEIFYAFKHNNPYPSLAARFAAKEAFRKLHPLFIRGIRFQDVEVINSADGRPQLFLYNNALHQKELANIDKIALSISHAKQQAIATIVAQERVV
ncbi:MAG: holo-ACP synthase [Syntrophomonadaceae bacterium]|nr:holo-ACP synthase [Syntrophomonadaceae bacterium]